MMEINGPSEKINSGLGDCIDPALNQRTAGDEWMGEKRETK